ncbi:hypothetical protein EVAR_89867_1 [Eumeta japonica]|uniref:Uncharacterized protein n=1 Tax=Eumeta variegata TaxID=151549 RepID=A0A4C1ZLL3_EUMVA|nr:hypothetical protein EVAR_89867_1 [Eumeta japonica]
MIIACTPATPEELLVRRRPFKWDLEIPNFLDDLFVKMVAKLNDDRYVNVKDPDTRCDIHWEGGRRPPLTCAVADGRFFHREDLQFCTKGDFAATAFDLFFEESALRRAGGRPTSPAGAPRAGRPRPARTAICPWKNEIA